MLWRTFSTECSVPVLSRAPPDKKTRMYCEPVRAVDVRPQDELSRALGAAMTDPAGRADHLVLHGIRVHSLRETKELLRANGTQILGLATETMNVAMEFYLQDPIQHLIRATSPNGTAVRADCR
jgi:hypothetical protein